MRDVYLTQALLLTRLRLPVIRDCSGKQDTGDSSSHWGLFWVASVS